MTTFGTQSSSRIAGARRRSSIIADLSLFPELGHKQEEESGRKIVTRRYSYRVYYMTDVATDEIIVIAIRHPARRPEHSDA